MAISELKRALLFLVLCLAQALVFNHIHLFGYATVLLYVYFVVMFPRNYPRWALLLWSFSLVRLLQIPDVGSNLGFHPLPVVLYA